MAKFTKYNNPNRRNHGRKKSGHSQAYINAQKAELYSLIAQAETEEQKELLAKAYEVTINP